MSVVVPLLNEEKNIPAFYENLAQVAKTLDMPWEVIFVDDGSTDGSWNTVVRMQVQDDTVKGLRLSRNFGHQAALLAGMSYASGDVVVTMDADLQHPPELIPRLVEEWRKGSLIVNTIRKEIDSEKYLKKWTSRMYYRLFSRMSGVEMRPGMADYRLLDRQVLDEILRFGEHALFFRGIVQWVGFPAANVEYTPAERFAGESSYSLYRMLRLAWHGIISFSIIPLRVSVVLGFVTSLVSFVGFLYAVLAKLLADVVMPGWSSTLALLSFLIGVLFIIMGLQGEYLGQVLAEVRGRPRYLVYRRAGFDEQQVVSRPVDTGSDR